MLIVLAGSIGYFAIKTTEKYVIQREILDLQDETLIARLRIENRLRSMQATVLANMHTLEPQSAADQRPSVQSRVAFGAQCGSVETPTFVDEKTLERIGHFPSSKEAQDLGQPRKLIEDVTIWLARDRSSRSTTDAFWSNIDWQAKSNSKQRHDDREVQIPKGSTKNANYLGEDLALVTIVIPIMRGAPLDDVASPSGLDHAPENTNPAGSRDKETGKFPISDGFLFVKFDLTDALTELFDPRAFVALFNSEMQPVLMPFGRPKSGQNRMGKYLHSVLDQYQDSVNNSPESMKEGGVFPQPETNQQQWKKFSDVFDVGVTSPIFAESHDLSKEAVESLSKNDDFKKWQAGPPPPGDPLRSVTIPTDTFRRIRVRASNPEALADLKSRLSNFVGLEQINWNSSRVQSDIVVNIHAIEAPGQSAGIGSQTERRPFLYLVRAVAEKEISGAVHADLEGLFWYSIVAVAISMFVACLLALLMIRPLRTMSRLARLIGSLELSDARDIEKAQHIITELPNGMRNEAGILGSELKGMVEKLLAANKHLHASQTELQQARDSLDLRVKLKTRELEKQRDIADEASKAKSIFLATTSHDMRQPLHVVFTHCELLRDSNLSDEQLESLNFIEKNATRLKFLTNDILDYQLLLSGEIILRSEDIPVASMLDDLVEHMRDQAEENNNSLCVKCDFHGNIHLDRPRIERILVNLLSNACKFTRRGHIEISAYPVGKDQIEFRIHDTGQGMTEAQQKRLFEPLMSARHRGHDGTGLGLYICKGVTESMGGQLRFESKVDVGSTFYVRLPIHVDSTNESVPATAQTLASLESPPDTASADDLVRNSQERNYNVRPNPDSLLALIIDDDDSARRVLGDILRRQGYRTLEADNGITGIALARQHHPDVISLDVIMPDMDGWQVLAELKSDVHTENIPVVMATVSPDIQKGNVLGADGYVTKPFSTSSVSSAIEKALTNGSNNLILIVDDETAVRQDLRRLIESCGWSVMEAADGVEALERIDQQIPGLAVVDLDMPNMDGFALIEKLRQMPETEHLPIIVLSALTLATEQQQRLQWSVNRFFGKGGLDLPELNLEISRLLRRHNSPETHSQR
ncbi:MAG: response regulator [Pirellula sp.]|nr:response regulator [Pirellula sp.]